MMAPLLDIGKVVNVYQNIRHLLYTTVVKLQVELARNINTRDGPAV